MGGLDRLARIAVGLLLVVLALLGIIGAWGWLGLIPLATGAIGYCPLYTPLGGQYLPSGQK